MRYKEQDLQISCVRWFRYQYPAFARLLEHPKNEGTADRTRGKIAKAEGVQAGVADLILHVPAYISSPSIRHSDCYQSLAIEMKTKRGSQKPEQKEWQRLFEAAGGKYVIVRSFEDFQTVLDAYMSSVPEDVNVAVKDAYAAIENEANKKALQKFKNIIKPRQD